MRTLCLVLTLLLLQTPVMGQERPKAPCLMRVAYTGSMIPTLVGGEVVRVLACAIENVPVGSVVVSERIGAGIYPCHRVIYKGRAANGGTYLITKGDNNRERDFIPVSKEDFIGVVDLPIKPP